MRPSCFISWSPMADKRRYAYFKKLTYFSTECIYSPDGQLTFDCHDCS